jgi:hypothetical protein
MRRCTLRGQENILKRLLIHVGAFNISLVLRKMLGAGTPRELKNRAARLVLRLFQWLTCRYPTRWRSRIPHHSGFHLTRHLPLRQLLLPSPLKFIYFYHGLLPELCTA